MSGPASRSRVAAARGAMQGTRRAPGRRAQGGPGGFTLIEMLVALAILAVLVSMAAPVVQLQAQRQRETELRAALREIRDAIDAYKRAADERRITVPADASGYPPSLAALVDGVPDAGRPKAPPLRFLRRVPRDPMATDGSVPAAETWALRSYDSPPDAPREGRDVYDVRSRATAVGLNGVPYDRW